MEKYTNQMRNVKYDVETKRQYNKNKGTTYKRYCNDILTLDIETTSAWLEGDKIISYRKGMKSDYWNALEPLSLCYIWQFSFNEKVYYGRELRDFENVLKDLPTETEVVIWVHNLSFEFAFLNNFLEWKTVFARAPHKPMKCVPKEYPHIEFRCSYMLTRLKLETWGKELGVLKAVGDLDYEQIRTPYTELTEKEMHYAEQDCIVVYAGIKTYKKRYGNIRSIPLTQTGTVRRVVKEMLMSDKEYVSHIKRLIPKHADEYKMLMNVFSGGYTHASRMYSNQTLEGTIEHYDFASSYPSVMVCEKFPDTVWLYQFDNNLPSESEIENYAYIMQVKFTKLICRTYNTYIQYSKTDAKKVELDNGRVLKAEELTMYITELDWLTIKESYDWDSVEVLQKYRAKKNYLPKKFIEYILELYGNKTSLKDVEGEEELYMQSKQYINSLFGMCVTAIVQPNVTFDGKEWKIDKLNRVQVNDKLKKLKDTREREKRYFLSYSWGCWITAYARRNLWKCILSCDRQVLYCDTDSIFVLGKHDFTWYNNQVTEKLRKSCKDNEIDFQLTRPKTVKGKEKPLGIFAQEPSCTEFRTLGAKRYVERREDNKLYLTVSGINKDAVELLENDIDNFVDGFNFDKDADCVTKRLSTYVTDQPIVKYDDGYVSTYKEGINMRRIGYVLTMTDEYKNLLKYTQFSLDDIDEHNLIKLKAFFI